MKYPQRTTRTAKKVVFFPGDTQPSSSYTATHNDVLGEEEAVNLIGNPEEARTQAERMSKDQRFVLSRGKYLLV
jgi:hypothetical protein